MSENLPTRIPAVAVVVVVAVVAGHVAHSDIPVAAASFLQFFLL